MRERTDRYDGIRSSNLVQCRDDFMFKMAQTFPKPDGHVATSCDDATKKMRLWIQVAERIFLLRVAGLLETGRGARPLPLHVRRYFGCIQLVGGPVSHQEHAGGIFIFGLAWEPLGVRQEEESIDAWVSRLTLLPPQPCSG